jgi:hypothetical protein
MTDFIPSTCPGHATWAEHEAFLDHTAAAIVSIATAAFPRDPVKAAALALYAATAAMLPEPVRPMDTSDIDPETGEEFGVGPDTEPEEELAYEAQQELEEQEAGS